MDDNGRQVGSAPDVKAVEGAIGVELKFIFYAANEAENVETLSRQKLSNFMAVERVNAELNRCVGVSDFRNKQGHRLKSELNPEFRLTVFHSLRQQVAPPHFNLAFEAGTVVLPTQKRRRREPHPLHAARMFAGMQLNFSHKPTLVEDLERMSLKRDLMFSFASLECQDGSRVQQIYLHGFILEALVHPSITVGARSLPDVELAGTTQPVGDHVLPRERFVRPQAEDASPYAILMPVRHLHRSADQGRIPFRLHLVLNTKRSRGCHRYLYATLRSQALRRKLKPLFTSPAIVPPSSAFAFVTPNWNQRPVTAALAVNVTLRRRKP